MRKNIKKVMLVIIIVIGIISTILLCVSLSKKDNAKIILSNLKQTIAGESTIGMSITGKVITQNVSGKHIATVKLYKVTSKTEELILTKNTEPDGTYEFNISEVGNYKVIAEKTGYLANQMHAIEVRKGDSLILADIELMPGDANCDGQIELEDIIYVTENYGDVTGEGIPVATKSIDFNGDGIINQSDKIFTKQAYTQITKDSLATVTSVENNLIEITMEDLDILYPSRDSYIRYMVKTNKEVELNDYSKVYLVQTGLTPEEITEEEANETREGYTLKSGEKYIQGSVNINGLGTNWLINLYFNNDAKNIKVVFAEGLFKLGEQVSEVTEVNIKLMIDYTSPEIELNGNSNVITIDENTELNIPIKVREEMSGMKSFTENDIEVIVDGVSVNPGTKTLTFNSSLEGIYNYTLALNQINARGTLTLKIPNGVVTDKAANTAQETILNPGIIVEQETMPITSSKEYVASIEIEGQPETAIKYATLTEAVAQSEEGKIIKLLTSFAENTTIEAGKKVKLDLNGNILGNSTANTIINYGNLEVIDSVGTGMIQNTATSYYAIQNIGTVTINANIKGNAILLYNSGIMNIESGEISAKSEYGSCCITNYNSTSVLNIKGGKITADGSGSTGIQFNQGTLNMTDGEINITGQDVYGINAYSTNEKVVNIIGGKIIINEDMPAQSYYIKNYGIYISGASSKAPAILNIGTDDGNVNVTSPYISTNRSGVSTRWSTYNLYDGLFVGNSQYPTNVPSNYVYNSYAQPEGVVRAYLVPKDVAAYIMDGENKIYYNSIEDAINACPNNTDERVTIYLANDLTIDCSCESDENGETNHTCGLTIPQGKKIKIDINSQNIYVTHNGITNNGDLQICSSAIRTNATDVIINNGNLELTDISVSSNIINNGIMKLSGSAYVYLYSENEKDVIENNGYLEITDGSSVDHQGGNAIKNNQGAKLILGDKTRDINATNPRLGAQSGYTIVNKGTVEYYNGTLSGNNELGVIDGEITKTRENYEYECLESQATLKLKNAVAYTYDSEGKQYYFTLQEAFDDLINNQNLSSVYLLNNVEENLKIKYNPLYNRRRLSIYLNGYSITGTGTTILNNANGDLSINGPGKIISTNGCALQSDSYISISNVEIQGKAYGIINNASISTYGTNVTGNIAIKNNNSFNYGNGNNEEGNTVQINGTEIGIENNGYFSLSSCMVTGNIAIMNSEEKNMYVYNEDNIITGIEVGIQNDGTLNFTGGEISGKTAIQGSTITTDSSHKTITTTENGIQKVEIQESEPPQISIYTSYETKYNEEFAVNINISDYESGIVEESFTIDDIIISLGTTGLEPRVKRLEPGEKQGYSYNCNLILAYDITDPSLSGQNLTIKIPANSVYDKYNNMNTELVYTSTAKIQMPTIQLGNVKYGTIEQACAVIPDGVETELKVIADITNPTKIPAGKIITLDTQDHIVKYDIASLESFIIEVYGTLNIREKTNISGNLCVKNTTGAINCYDGYVNYIANYTGTVKTYGGTVNSLVSYSTGLTSNEGATILNAWAEGGTYTQNSGLSKILYTSNSKIGTINIFGGSIGDPDCTKHATENRGNGKINIDNATINGVLYNNATATTEPSITVTNSTINSEASGIYNYNGTIKVSNSTINCKGIGVNLAKSSCYVILDNVNLTSGNNTIYSVDAKIDINNSTLKSSSTENIKPGMILLGLTTLNIGTADGQYVEDNTIIQDAENNTIGTAIKINMYDGKIIGKSISSILNAIKTIETGYTKNLTTVDNMDTIKLIEQ